MCPPADEPFVSAPGGAGSPKQQPAGVGTAETPPQASKRPRRARTGKISVLGVLGELLITAGALVLLFLGWQLWWNDMIMASSQSNAASQISQDWIEKGAAPNTPAPVTEDTQPSETTEPSVDPSPVGYGAPIVSAAPANATPFAVLYVPRFGESYHRTIAQGTGHDVLNSNRLGIGHYSDTQMPGEVGNFAVAAHRSAYGGAMHLINELQLGDAIYVQTAEGYYTYRYRDTEYVTPSQVQVLASVPNNPAESAMDRIITLTSCNPLYSTAERIIAYGILESWQPLSAGAPAELAPIISAQG